MDMIVYKATNKINGKVYIGKTIRSMSHAKARHHDRSKLGFNTYFYNSIRKHGIDEFIWEVIYKGISDKDIREKEISFIRQYNCRDTTKGYNMTDGGDGSSGIICKDSTRKLISANNKGEKNVCYGKFGNNHPAYGNKHSDETKKKISEAHKGKPKSDETKVKISKARLHKSKYSYKLRLKAIKLREQGYTYQLIADELEISSSAVAYKIITNFRRQYATVQTTSR